MVATCRTRPLGPLPGLSRLLRRSWLIARGASIRAVHALLLARLSAGAWLAVYCGARRRPRILATACGAFPIYSQTFVYQELCALAERDFALRFSYSTLGHRSLLDPRFSRLWRVRCRLVGGGTGCQKDWRYYQRKMPEKVDALTAAICAASGLSRDELFNHEHFLEAFSFARMAQAWRADYLHSYFFYERTLFTLVASWLLEIPRGVTCYADHMLDDHPLKLVRLNVTSCDVVVATSARIKTELETLCGVATLPNLVVKPNAIDTRTFTSGPRPSAAAGQPAQLVCVNRIEPKKGLAYLVDAVGILLGQGVSVELHVVGAPDQHNRASVRCAKELEAQIGGLGLGATVCLEGRQTGREVRRFLTRSTVFVAPYVELENGDKDGIPTALLEAMASGCAIVATDAGSIAEVIDDGESGLLVPQRDAVRLAAAIRRLVSDPALRTRLGRMAADKAVRHFDVAHSEEPFHQRIRRAIAQRKS
jgi:colanic acid/amylovoran biosynthesis glycosyltransferase